MRDDDRASRQLPGLQPTVGLQGLIHPELMPPFRPGPRGWPDNPLPYDGLYLCGAACHGGPGVTFIPGYNAGYEVLEAADRDPGPVAVR